jgi:hypothetical protein
MAATATQQVIVNSSRNLVLKYTIAGTTGDISDSVLVDISALDSTLGVNGLTLLKAKAALTGFSAKLMWNATTNIDIVEFPTDEPFEQDYSEFGGIKNNAGTGADGDVLITTTGYTASGDGGHIYLWFRKT